MLKNNKCVGNTYSEKELEAVSHWSLSDQVEGEHGVNLIPRALNSTAAQHTHTHTQIAEKMSKVSLRNTILWELVFMRQLFLYKQHWPLASSYIPELEGEQSVHWALVGHVAHGQCLADDP